MKKMNKSWYFTYVYQWSPQRYCKTIEADDIYNAYDKFGELFPNNDVIIVGCVSTA